MWRSAKIATRLKIERKSFIPLMPLDGDSNRCDRSQAIAEYRSSVYLADDREVSAGTEGTAAVE
jgi:hypothetical protein